MVFHHTKEKEKWMRLPYKAISEQKLKIPACKLFLNLSYTPEVGTAPGRIQHLLRLVS